MAQVEINSINFSGQQVNVVYTPNNSSESYGLGIKTIPFIFDSTSISNQINIYGAYSLTPLNSNCNYILVI